MSKKVSSLVLDAMDWHDRLKKLQALLEICLEQIEDTTEGVGLRIDLLVDSYLSQAELCLDELNTDLVQIQQQAITQRELQENWLLWRMLVE